MADTKASQAGRELVRTRWGNQVVSRAVSVVVERRDELTDEQLAELAHAIDPARDGDRR
jgi:hypothetical protein